MMRPLFPSHLTIAAVLLAFCGCGKPRAPAPEKTAAQPKPVAAHEISESTIMFSDPKGRWKLAVQAKRVEAATVHGPYDMSPATARYDEVGKPPVTMSARRAHIDEAAHRAVFEGAVRVSSATWRLEADRVDYDLKTGEVVATGNTKWVFTEGSAPALQPPSAGKDGKP